MKREKEMSEGFTKKILSDHRLRVLQHVLQKEAEGGQQGHDQATQAPGKLSYSPNKGQPWKGVPPLPPLPLLSAGEQLQRKWSQVDPQWMPDPQAWCSEMQTKLSLYSQPGLVQVISSP